MLACLDIWKGYCILGASLGFVSGPHAHNGRGDVMKEFISENITPLGARDAGAMSRGEPGLPVAFAWRDARYEVLDCLAAWKVSSRERGVGELYLRRHYYRLRMSDHHEWTVYFLRQAQSGAPAIARWFLYTING